MIHSLGAYIEEQGKVSKALQVDLWGMRQVVGDLKDS